MSRQWSTIVGVRSETQGEEPTTAECRSNPPPIPTIQGNRLFRSDYLFDLYYQSDLLCDFTECLEKTTFLPLQGITSNDMYRFVTHHVNKRNSVLKWLYSVSTDSLYEKQTSSTSMKKQEVEATDSNEDEESSLTTVDEHDEEFTIQTENRPIITATSAFPQSGTRWYRVENGRVIIPNRPMSN